MNKQTKALKRALDWIEGNGKYDAAKRVAQAIREALAEQPAIKQDLTPEQPAPVAEPRKPQQEPVACANGCRGFVKHSTPAQRTWVGLTDEEAIFLIENELLSRSDLIETIEAKLKEKND